jgi:cytidylate kinase
MPWKISSDSRILAKALERQMTNWELARLQRLERAPDRSAEVEDFVTISRQVGVAAEEVAARLSERLGWPAFGKNLLEAMAGDEPVRRQIYESMDERDLGWWQEALRSLLDQDFNLNDYFHRLSETVLSLARQGSCIFVGRGCDLLLPQDLGFRVRLVAQFPDRLAHIEGELGLHGANARRNLERIEAARSEFVSHHYRADANDPTRHDLVLNLSRWSIEQAVDAILAARAVRA